MGIKHKGTIPRFDDLTIYYDMSNPKCNGSDIIDKLSTPYFHEVIDGTSAMEIHSELNAFIDPAWHAGYVASGDSNAEGRAQGLRCGTNYKDLSGNNYDCLAISAPDMYWLNSDGDRAWRTNKNMGPIEGDWYFERWGDYNIDDDTGAVRSNFLDGTYQSIGAAEFPDQTSGSNGDYHTTLGHMNNYTGFNEGIYQGADHFDYSTDVFKPYIQPRFWANYNGGDKVPTSAQSTKRGYTAQYEIADHFGLINGRPAQPMYAVIYRTNSTFDTSDSNQQGPGLSQLKWRVVVGDQVVESNGIRQHGVESDCALKIGDIVSVKGRNVNYDGPANADLKDYGEFEIGPVVAYNPMPNRIKNSSFINHDANAGDTALNTTNTGVGTTWHAIRPAKSNTTFPKPKYKIDEFRKAYTPLIADKKSDSPSDYIIFRDMLFTRFDMTNAVDEQNVTLESEFYIHDSTALSASKSDSELYHCRISNGRLWKKEYDKEYEVYVYTKTGQLLGWYQTTNTPPVGGTQTGWTQSVLEGRPYGTCWLIPIWQRKEGASSTSSTFGSYSNTFMAEYGYMVNQGNTANGYSSSYSFDARKYSGYKRVRKNCLYDVVICELKTASNTADGAYKKTSEFPPVKYEPLITQPGYMQCRGVIGGGNVAIHQFDENRAYGAVTDEFGFGKSGESASKFSGFIWVRGNGHFPGQHNTLYQLSAEQPLFDFGHFCLEIVGMENEVDDTIGRAGWGRIRMKVRSINLPVDDDETPSSILCVATTEQIPDLLHKGLNTWNLIGVTYSISSNKIAIYYNGVEIPLESNNANLELNNLIPSTLPIIGQGTQTKNALGYIGRAWHQGSGYTQASPSGSDVLAHLIARSGTTEGNNNNDKYNDHCANYDVASFMGWKDVELTATEVAELYENTKSTFDVVPIDNPNSHLEGLPFYKKDAYAPKQIDEALKDFTSETSVGTVTQALQGVQYGNVTISCWAVIDQDHVAVDLPRDTTTAYDGNMTSVGWSEAKAQNNPTGFGGATPYRGVNPRCWNDPKLDLKYEILAGPNTSLNTRPDRKAHPRVCLGLAGFSDDRYLGTTYMFVLDHIAAGSAEPVLGPQSGQLYSPEDVFRIFEELGSSSASRDINDLHLIHGFTHDVSGYYTSNGQPSSINNPYIQKTTEFVDDDPNVTNTDTQQGYSFSTNCGKTGADFYNATTNKLSGDGGVWGWKPGEFVHGNRSSSISGIWGIANWDGTNDANSVASWGPNKTFDEDDKVKFYAFWFTTQDTEF